MGGPKKGARERADLGRTALWVSAAALLAGAVVLTVISVNYHQVVTETIRGQVKTTVTGPPAPSVGVISALLGAGVALLLLASFFKRLREFNSPFGGVKLDPVVRAVVARKAAQAAQGDPEKAAKIYEHIAPQVEWRLRGDAISSAGQPGWIDELANHAAGIV